MSRTPLWAGLADNLEEHVRIDLGQMRNVRSRELLARFAFGAVAAALAGTVSILFGNRVGGLFLAFPAILPASITLISKKDGREKAEIDAVGATIGALSMIAFAATSLLLIGHLPIAAVETSAFVLWLAVATLVYFVGRELVRRSSASGRIRRARTPEGVQSSPGARRVARGRARG